MSDRGAVILCGGRSSRMGADKASLPFGRGTLLSRVVETLSSLVEDVVVVGRPRQELPPLPPHVRRAQDRRIDEGPLAGLHAGLLASRASRVYASSCDVPFLKPAFVELVFTALGEASAAVPEAEGFLHPLAAVYRRADVLPAAKALLESGERRLRALFDGVVTVKVPETALRDVDVDLVSLRNLNHPEEYAAARAAWESPARGAPLVRVELFERARQIAGIQSVEVSAWTVREALKETAKLHPALVPEVWDGSGLTSHWRVALNGEEILADLDRALPEGSVLVLVSALAGG